MSQLLTEIRYSFRRLAQRPGLAATAVVALALGIGLTTAMYSIVNGVILVGLPFDEPHEIVSIARVNPSQTTARLVGRIHDYEDLRERLVAFESVAAINAVPLNVSPPGERPELILGAEMTASTFGLLGVAPQMGRAFTQDEEQPGGESVLMVGHRFWQERFDGSPDVVGSYLRVNGVEARIVGVMPDGFEFPVNQQLWQPLRADATQLPRGSSPPIQMIGRLAEGFSPVQGQQDLDRVMAQLAVEYPETNEGMEMRATPYVREVIGAQLTPFLFTMLGAVSFVLLIACANVANLLLARASLRTREVAIASALGAGRGRVFGQLLLEAGLLAVAGGVLGVGLAALAIRWFNGIVAALPQGVPFWFAIGIDPAVLAFVVGVTLAASLLSGLAPAFQASSSDVHEILKDAGRGGSSLRMGRLARGLVVAEVALSCALLVAAGLMIRSVGRMASVDLGFRQDGQFVAAIALPEATYPDAVGWQNFWAELEPRLEAIPGVESAGIGTDMPVLGFNNGRIAIDGKEYLGDRDYPSVRIGAVTPGYFDTLEVAPLEGRLLEPGDGADAQRVAVVNRAFAATHFPERSAIGERFAVRATMEFGGRSERNDDLFYTIVGVVPDLYLDTDLFILGLEGVYVPLLQRPSSSATIVLRTSGPPLEIASAARDAVASIDRDLPLAGMNSLEQAIADQQSLLRVFSGMFTVFGAVALFLATIGLYGVLSFAVSQRLHEMGIRVALGASPARVLRMVMRQGMAQLALGMGVGLVLALGLSRLLGAVLYDVSATDPLVFGGIVVALGLTGALACLLPARRATRVDPLEAMRVD